MARICTWLFLALMAVGCAPTAKVKLVMQLRPDQESLYRARILKPFEKKHNCIVELRTYQDPAKLPELLAAGDTIDLGPAVGNPLHSAEKKTNKQACKQWLPYVMRAHPQSFFHIPITDCRIPILFTPCCPNT